MRLYTRTGATALDDPEYGHFEADAQGGFDFPDDLSDRLHSFHWRGRPQWETDIERQQRLIHEELERRKDPATLLSVVEQYLGKAEQVVTGQQVAPAEEEPAAEEPVEPAPTAKPARARKTPSAKPKAAE